MDDQIRVEKKEGEDWKQRYNELVVKSEKTQVRDTKRHQRKIKDQAKEIIKLKQELNSQKLLNSLTVNNILDDKPVTAKQRRTVRKPGILGEKKTPFKDSTLNTRVLSNDSRKSSKAMSPQG